MLAAIQGDWVRLVRVVAIGQEIDVADVRVELIALEVRDAGAILYWKAYPAVERMLGDMNVTVSDERGTDYTTFPAGGGSGGREWKGELSITPAPPPDVRVRVHILGFAGFGGAFPMPIQTPVEGNWEFNFGTGHPGA
ncbi:MAG TPA: hypothetical protein VGQ89_14990 [Candidatus Limnocylindrales bacterium]|jgi:hypothetical protein|nr:hypothetical protein [Candidatus Limnocylindrales bacterium]